MSSPVTRRVIAITGGTVVPVSSAPIPGGTVLIGKTKILAVGSPDEVVIPDGAEIIDATGKWVLPGFVDGHAHVGINEEGNGVAGDDTNETTSPNMAGVRALDGINIEDEGFRDALSAGITSVSVKPGSGNPIGGQTVALKTWGGLTVDDQVISSEVSVKSAFGENPKLVYGGSHMKPMTRMGIAVVIRQAFEDAKQYVAREKIARESGQPYEKNLDLAALGRVLSGELLWDVHVHRHDDIATAMRIADEFGLRLVINHGTEAHQLAELIAQRGIPVAVGPVITARSKQELRDHTIASAAMLWAAGVNIAIITDHPEVPINLLPVQAMLAVREGLPREEALRAITVNPAAILGLDSRVGALQVGLDADVVIWSGDPLTMDARAELVLINGDRVYEWDAHNGLGVVVERFPHAAAR